MGQLPQNKLNCDPHFKLDCQLVSDCRSMKMYATPHISAYSIGGLAESSLQSVQFGTITSVKQNTKTVRTTRTFAQTIMEIVQFRKHLKTVFFIS